MQPKIHGVMAPGAVLSRFGLDDATLTQIPTGLIHKTFRVDTPRGRFALQSVSKIFQPQVNEDIEAVTLHLADRGLVTPRLVRTIDGALWTEQEGEIWRVLTWIEGDTLQRIGAPREAERAGGLLARFHFALSDLEHTFKARRLGVHDTPRHLRVLREAVAAHGGHRLHEQVAELAGEIFDRAASLPDLSSLPERIVHGDPKINNVIFDPKSKEATAFVDLDTIAPMLLPLELGDAFRSWCNTSGEDATTVEFSLPIFEAATAGYAAGARGFLLHREIELLVPVTAMIIVELAARFAADALNEQYFGWDATRFPARGEHNLVRAKGQLALARDFASRASEASRLVAKAFGA